MRALENIRLRDKEEYLEKQEGSQLEWSCLNRASGRGNFIYILGPLDGNPADTWDGLHTQLQHCLPTLLLAPALLRTPIGT